MPRRTAPPRQPVLPPKDAEEGAERVRAVLVKLFDRGDGTGADWRLLLESLYRAGFRLADAHLQADARQKIMRRVHEGAEVRMTGGFADGERAGEGEPGCTAAPSCSNAAGRDSPAPRPG